MSKNHLHDWIWINSVPCWCLGVLFYVGLITENDLIFHPFAIYHFGRSHFYPFNYYSWQTKDVNVKQCTREMDHTKGTPNIIWMMNRYLWILEGFSLFISKIFLFLLYKKIYKIVNWISMHNTYIPFSVGVNLLESMIFGQMLPFGTLIVIVYIEDRCTSVHVYVDF